uniref:Intracellular protein transport protein uso1-like n=1 Tax=Crassostrea virginica TaxID=6565 RepID=A0A8B8EJW3_CRAVI|nr:intracellular protein transport protein uso1-like [Crassostrea virginica]
MMQRARFWFVIVLTVSISLNGAQIIYEDQDVSMVSETIVAETVKQILLSNIGSIGEEIKKELSFENQRASSYSSAKVPSSSLENKTKVISNTMKRLDLDVSEINNTVFLMDDNVQRLKENITKLTGNDLRSKGDMFILKQNMTDTMHMALLRLNDSLISEVEDVKNYVKDIVQNMSLINDFLTLLHKFEKEFNQSLKNVMEEVLQNKKVVEESGNRAVEKCVKVAEKLEESVDEKLIISVANVSKSLNMTRNQIDSRAAKMNQSLVLIEEQMQNLFSDASKLENALVENEIALSELKRNGTISSENLHDKIKELSSNMSSVANEITQNQSDLFQKITRNLSELSEIFSSSLNSVSNKVRAVELLSQDLERNMTSSESALESSFQLQLDTTISNFTSTVKHLEELMFEKLEKLRLENNETMRPLVEMMDVQIKDMLEKLNETNIQLMVTNSKSENCMEYVDQRINNQSIIFSDINLELIKIIKANMSLYNDSLYEVIREVEGNRELIDRQLTQRLDQYGVNISDISRQMDTLKSLNNDNNNKISEINTQLTNLSASLTTLKTNLSERRRNSDVIRIVNGDSTSGRVEIFHNGAWGTVCDDNWDAYDAIVVCRMLGLSGGLARGSATFGQGSGNIWLDEVSCNGQEQSLFSCVHPSYGQHDCSHGEDAGVVCT